MGRENRKRKINQGIERENYDRFEMPMVGVVMASYFQSIRTDVHTSTQAAQKPLFHMEITHPTHVKLKVTLP